MPLFLSVHSAFLAAQKFICASANPVTRKSAATANKVTRGTFIPSCYREEANSQSGFVDTKNVFLQRVFKIEAPAPRFMREFCKFGNLIQSATMLGAAFSSRKYHLFGTPEKYAVYRFGSARHCECPLVPYPECLLVTAPQRCGERKDLPIVLFSFRQIESLRLYCVFFYCFPRMRVRLFFKDIVKLRCLCELCDLVHEHFSHLLIRENSLQHNNSFLTEHSTPLQSELQIRNGIRIGNSNRRLFTLSLPNGSKGRARFVPVGSTEKIKHMHSLGPAHIAPRGPTRNF